MAPIKRKQPPVDHEPQATRRTTRQTLKAPPSVQQEMEPRAKRQRVRQRGANSKAPKAQNRSAASRVNGSSSAVTHNGDIPGASNGEPVPTATQSGNSVGDPPQSRQPNGHNNVPNLAPLKQHFVGEKPGGAKTLQRPVAQDRNIDKVVFGNLCFKTWYPSYLNNDDFFGAKSHAKSHAKTKLESADEKGGERKPQAKKERETDMLSRLYVCPCCFKYSKELVAWWEHVRICEQRCHVPGEKIYTHPKGKRTTTCKPAVPTGRGTKRKRRENGLPMVEVTVQDDGEWSIWEVDGAQDTLFCQNLSLFAKLFLETKSVFFDVTNFKYFLLVYTPPAPSASNGSKSQPNSLPPPTPQVVGFFSKEKMSWDNNNVACILVFAPWQRKGLGALLMGISYEISRREAIMGGPEKPISELGKKGYKRFWADQIARWILTHDIVEDGETTFTVAECSEATYITPDDCLIVLREMGLFQPAVNGPPKKRRKAISVVAKDELEAAEEAREKTEALEDVPRLSLSTAALWNWITKNKIGLDMPCDPDGFVDGYAIYQSVEEDDDTG